MRRAIYPRDPRTFSELCPGSFSCSGEEAERRRVETKGGEGIREYFRSHIWPTHRAYVEGAVARTPLVAFLSGTEGEEGMLRQALSCPQLLSCLGGGSMLEAAQVVPVRRPYTRRKLMALVLGRVCVHLGLAPGSSLDTAAEGVPGSAS